MNTIREKELVTQTGINNVLVSKWRKDHLKEGEDFSRSHGPGKPILYHLTAIEKFNSYFQIQMHPPVVDEKVDAQLVRNNFLNKRIVQVKRLDTGEILKASCRNAPDYKGAQRLLWIRWDNGRWSVPYRENKVRRFLKR